MGEAKEGSAPDLVIDGRLFLEAGLDLLRIPRSVCRMGIVLVDDLVPGLPLCDALVLPGPRWEALGGASLDPADDVRGLSGLAGLVEVVFVLAV